MNLNDLSAHDLTRLDAVCLDFERALRAGEEPSIKAIVSLHGGAHAELLQQELQAVKAEIDRAGTQVAPPFAVNVADATHAGDDKTATPLVNTASFPSEHRQVGPYRITGQLGAGGMGVVYDAIDTRLDRRVAIKMLQVAGSQRQELVNRFEHEAKAVAALTHPNIVELFDVGVADGIPYAVMEYLRGETLAQRLSRCSLSAAEVRQLGMQIAEALAVAHEHGVVHRDLKPQNVMLLNSRPDSLDDAAASRQPHAVAYLHVKVFDFGLSRVPRDADAEDKTTKAGIILGTPGYMSPEQARGEQATATADVFSLGCVLYEAFYGQTAISGATLADRIAATLNDTAVGNPARRRDDIELADLIEQCLAKAPGMRPSSAEIAARLRTSPFENSPVTSGSVAGTDSIARRRFLTSMGGGVCGALVGAMWTSEHGTSLADIRSIAVLSIRDDSTVGEAGMPGDGQPLGVRPLNRGQKIAVLLVNELSRMNDISVPPFRPLEASLPSEFQALGQSLGVDALLTGAVRVTSDGDGQQQTELELQLVSASQGHQIWGDTFVTKTTEDLLPQSRFAGEIAAQIGRRLTATAASASPPNAASFNCLVDGKARSDPDSIKGLQRALMCFEKAKAADDQFVDPVAGIALTSITLAAQSNAEETVDYVQRAQTEMDRAIKLDSASTEARLARAMLNWQTRPRVREALAELRELTMKDPNRWQVQHQYGLLQLALGNHEEAKLALRDASRLNPHSVLLKTDRVRADWIVGSAELALTDALRYRDRYQQHVFARGLLVDIYEQQGDFAAAADQHQAFPATKTKSKEDYFRHRQNLIAELPYGPFGDLMNGAILKARLGQVDDRLLGDLADSLSPMFPLLLAVHPAFATVRLTPRGRQLLPKHLMEQARAIEVNAA